MGQNNEKSKKFPNNNSNDSSIIFLINLDQVNSLENNYSAKTNIQQNPNSQNIQSNMRLNQQNNIQPNPNNQNPQQNVQINQQSNFQPSNNNLQNSQPKELSEAEYNELVQSGKICVICLEPFSYTVESKKIECGHVFCKNCIMKSIELNPYCPVCRTQIDYDKEFNNGVRRNRPNNGIRIIINGQEVNTNDQVFRVNFGNTGNWNISTIRNIFTNNNQYYPVFRSYRPYHFNNNFLSYRNNIFNDLNNAFGFNNNGNSNNQVYHYQFRF